LLVVIKTLIPNRNFVVYNNSDYSYSITRLLLFVLAIDGDLLRLFRMFKFFILV